MRLFFCVFCFYLLGEDAFAGRVRVKIYDHRAEHDPDDMWATGPWKFKGYGYGLEYQYNDDGSYQREKGYGYTKMFGRDFCKNPRKCRPIDPKFFEQVKFLEKAEPYWAHPPADVVQENGKHLNPPDSQSLMESKPNHLYP